MNHSYAPKQWSLSSAETITTYESWRQNLLYILDRDLNFAEFLNENAKWKKKDKKDPMRGFLTDEHPTVAMRNVASRKLRNLELMLGLIANYCPVIARNTITYHSTCLEDIWRAIRLHYGFLSSGGGVLSFSDIVKKSEERPEDLYQRLRAFIEDNLVKSNDLEHMGSKLEEEEEISPTLENLVVVHWLNLLHPQLPTVVQHRYATELRSRTLVSLRPEISQALSSLLDELDAQEAVKVMRTQTRNSYRGGSSYKASITQQCVLCKQAKRPYDHFLSKCRFLPDGDKKYFARARQVVGDPDYTDQDGVLTDEVETIASPSSDLPPPGIIHNIRRIQIRESPFLDVFYGHHTVRITIDSGATGNMINIAAAQRIGAKIKPSSQFVRQADGASQLNVVGETDLTFTRNGQSFRFHALVVKNLEEDALGGTVFMEVNDISVRPSRKEVLVGTVSYVYNTTSDSAAVRTQRVTLMRAPPYSTTVYPGEYLEISLPEDAPPNSVYALEPRTDAPVARRLTPGTIWPRPDTIGSIDGKIRIPNTSNQTVILQRNEHFAQIWPTYSPPDPDECLYNVEPQASKTSTMLGTKRDVLSSRVTTSSSTENYSSCVQLDPDRHMPAQTRLQFEKLHLENDVVFDSNYPGYNGHVGDIKAHVNIGPVQPPQRKGRLPMYNTKNLDELQCHFDELEAKKVLIRPEEANVNVEYLNPSFLVKKPNGKFRMVTAFTDVARYSKPQPSLLPDVDSTLRKIGQWKYLIKSDLASAYYQVPLSQESMKYCGVSSPYRGTFVYARSAMGMPGSETALEQLMCRIFERFQTNVAKIADDFYVGGQTYDELLFYWSQVLQALKSCDLRLSASKTVVCPQSMEILGWVWRCGILEATPHRLSTLSLSAPPKKVSGLRSFIGAYKVLARVLPDCASYVTPLDNAVAGKQSTEELEWSETLEAAFSDAKSALRKCKSIFLPRQSDRLWLVTDGATRSRGIGATLYIQRDSQLHLAGFYSAKLKGHQDKWLPCEVEALSIAAAVKHFSPYIVQSNHRTCILTDSKPCVQAYEKLCRGEFSASPRVYTFLSTISRFQISIQHVAGCSILPSDYASRNAPNCEERNCQICKFVNESEDLAVRSINVSDILSGRSRLPYTSRSAWLSIQRECPDLTLTREYLEIGNRPSKKMTRINDVKRYLRVATKTTDGMLIVRREIPLLGSRDLIIVPRRILHGLLMSLHLRLAHPSGHQLHKVVSRSFYALDLDGAIDTVTRSCHQCTAMSQCSAKLEEQQSTSDSPEAVGLSFAADVLRRERQCVLVVRETLTSFTVTKLIDNERALTLRDGIIQALVGLCPQNGPITTVRCDPAPGFVGLANDKLLQEMRIVMEVGQAKNANKNPVAERAVQEIGAEIVKIQPSGGPVSPVTLAIATASLNSRIRENGLASREMFYQRDQFTGRTLSVPDCVVASEQHRRRLANHGPSARSKCTRGGPSRTLVTDINVGDLVYVISDRDKTRARNRYIVISVEGLWCNIRKFTDTQLRAASYKVRISDCRKVQSELLDLHQYKRIYQDDNLEVIDSNSNDPNDNIRDVNHNDTVYDFQSTRECGNDNVVHPGPPVVPLIPREISEPLDGQHSTSNGNSNSNREEPTVNMNNHSNLDTGNSMDNHSYHTACNNSDTRLPNRSRRVPPWHRDYIVSYRRCIFY